jgi:hypothetical protein
MRPQTSEKRPSCPSISRPSRLSSRRPQLKTMVLCRTFRKIEFFQQPARPTSGRAIEAAIPLTLLCAMACASGREMMMGMANARCTVTPAREREPGSGRICAPSEGSLSSTYISTSPRMKPCSIPNRSHPRCFGACAFVASQRTLVTHEPNL